MALKEVFAPHLGRHVKLGRKRPVAPCPRMRLRDYLRAALPTPPGSADYTAQAASVLANIYGNDSLGDCVIAGGYHVVGVETGNAGDLFTASQDQIIADYGAIGGYNPADPSTDQGCDEQTALNYWVSKGFANGTKLVGWLAVDATNEQELQTALWLFENLYFGIELPDAWVNPMPSAPGFTWDVAGAADHNNGHCIMGAGYDTTGVTVCTWGMLGKLTYAAIKAYCVAASGGELYVMLSPDQLAKGQSKAPNGVAWLDLLSDFNSMGGNVPVPTTTPPTPAPSPAPAPAPSPAPAPAPSPAPAPAPSPDPAPAPSPDPAPAPDPAPPTPAPALPPDPSLAQVALWIEGAFKNAPILLTRTEAMRVAMNALTQWPT
jgi:hypothetical protein